MLIFIRTCVERYRERDTSKQQRQTGLDDRYSSEPSVPARCLSAARTANGYRERWQRWQWWQWWVWRTWGPFVQWSSREAVSLQPLSISLSPFAFSIEIIVAIVSNAPVRSTRFLRARATLISIVIYRGLCRRGFPGKLKTAMPASFCDFTILNLDNVFEVF